MKSTVPQPSKSIVAFYDSHDKAEDAVIRLQQSGYDMKQFSIIAVDLYTTEKVLGYFGSIDKMKHWAISGGFWVGFWGLLFGFSTYSIPIIGPVLIQGWVGAIVAGLTLAAVGAVFSAAAAFIYSRFTPEHKKVKYATEVKAGKYMLLAQGAEVKIAEVREILELQVPKEKHDATDWRENISNF